MLKTSCETSFFLFSSFFSLHLFTLLLTDITSVDNMAANTKYQRAPQRDSLDEPSYSQAPPSYQAESSQGDGLLGGPRSEDDNVPDDFKVCRRTDNVLSSGHMLNKWVVWWLRR